MRNQAWDAEEDEADVDMTMSEGVFDRMTRQYKEREKLELTKQEQNEDEDDTYKTMWVHSR